MISLHSLSLLLLLLLPFLTQADQNFRQKRADLGVGLAADFGANIAAGPRSDQCTCEWTEWMNSHNPLETKNQNEHETIENLRKKYQFCPDPKDVQCRSVEDHQLFLEKDKHGCTLSGFTCNLFCFDFEIRYKCCECIPDDIGPRFRIHLQPQSLSAAQQSLKKQCLYVDSNTQELKFGPVCSNEQSVFTWVNNNKLKSGTKCLTPKSEQVNSGVIVATCNEQDNKQNFALQEESKSDTEFYSQVRLQNRYRFINVDFDRSNSVKMHYSANSKGSKFVAKLVSRRSSDLEQYPLSTFTGHECEEITDSDPNGKVICNFGNFVGSQCSKQCSQGYTLDSSTNKRQFLRCEVSGDRGLTKWFKANTEEYILNLKQFRFPKCRQISCDSSVSNPSTFSNGKVLCNNKNFSKSVCRFTCTTGYTLNGDSALTCATDGVWDNARPFCQQVQCTTIDTSHDKRLSMSCTNKLSQNNYNSVCSLTCQKGFKINGVSRTRCQANGKWSDNFRDTLTSCGKTHCPEIKSSGERGLRVSCDKGRQIGSTCTFTCMEPQYEMSYGKSSETSSCQEDGRWSLQTVPDCHDMTCFQWNTFDDNIEIVCRQKQFTPQNLRIKRTIEFDTSPIMPAITEPSKKKSHTDAFILPNTHCELSCAEGYKLVGAKNIKCEPYRAPNAQPMSYWTDGITGNELQDQQSCQTITCLAINNFQNGKFECYDDIDAPVSEAGVVLKVPKQGKDRFKYGIRCNFECDQGYALHKEAKSIFCGEEGAWSYPPSTGCKRIICNRIKHDSVENGKISCSNANMFGSKCEFTCNSGYKLDTNIRTTECTDDGIWSDSIPKCVPIVCKDPYQLSQEQFGVRKPTFQCSNSFNVGSKCDYSCKIGYELYLGNKTNKCLSNGKWSAQAPMCIGRSCPALLPAPQPENEQFPTAKSTCTPSNKNSALYRYPTTCIFYCDNSYYPPATNKIECDASGAWVGGSSIPLCRPIRCNAIEKRSGTNIKCTDANLFRSICNFDCQEGFTMTGQPRITCEQTGWSHNPPICDKVSCPALPEIDHGVIECADEWQDGKLSCNVNCQSGYQFIGDWSDISCEAASGETRGTWSRSTSNMPKCQPLSCGTLSSVQKLKCKNSEGHLVDPFDCEHFGCHCEKVCHQNEAVRNGADSTTCILNSDSDDSVSWSGSLGVCELVVCPDISTISIPNTRSISCTNTNIKNSVCTVTCKNKFKLIGPQTFKCKDSGSWTQQSMFCEQITCTGHIAGFSAPTNGQMDNTDGALAGSIYSFSCDEGYKLIGESRIVCEYEDGWLDGRWSHSSAPKCQRITCQPPLTLNTQTKFSCKAETLRGEYAYGAECVYFCNDKKNYALIGEPSIKCVSDANKNGVFISKDQKVITSKTASQCKQITCSALPKISNGEVTCDANPVNSNGDFLIGTGCAVNCEPTHRTDFQMLECKQNARGAAKNKGHWVDIQQISRESFVCALKDKKTLFRPCVVPESRFPNITSHYIERAATDCNYAAKTCTIVCPENFDPVGVSLSSPKIYCDRKRKRWNKDLSKVHCKKRTCATPPTRSHTRISCDDQHYVSSKCTYTCDSNAFEFLDKVSYFSTTCSSSGSWKPSIPSSLHCRQARCFDPNVTNISPQAAARIDQPDDGETYTFSCDKGYESTVLSKKSSRSESFAESLTLTCYQEESAFYWRTADSLKSSIETKYLKPQLSCQKSSNAMLFSIFGLLIFLVIVAIAVFLFLHKNPDKLPFKPTKKSKYDDFVVQPTTHTDASELAGLLLQGQPSTKTNLTSPDRDLVLSTYEASTKARDSGFGTALPGVDHSSGRGSGLFESPLQVPNTSIEQTLNFPHAVNAQFIPQASINSFSKIISYQKIEDELEKRKDKHSFKTEFEAVPKFDTKQSVNMAKSNPHKNRYIDVIPYDYNRVKGEYVNASYVNGLDTASKFIAAMGPLDTTIFEFWNTIINENVGVIVMLTNWIEDGKPKCAQYFPIGTNDLTVDIVEEILFGEYIQRKLRINIGGSTTKEISHLQFTGWPDFGAPKGTQGLVKFIRKVKNEYENISESNNSPIRPPIMVHCSAGAGRTGTFIALDMIADHIIQNEGQACDFFGLVCHLRKQRPQLVQSFPQYQFIWHAASDMFRDGDTEIDVSELGHHYKVLCEIMPGNMTGLGHEFEKVRKLKNKYDCYAAMNNVEENFAATLVPYDFNRVKLMDMSMIGESNDYINASYIDGYILENSFIATQTPLHKTLSSFWQMIWENNIEIVVCLEPADDLKIQYFPTEINQTQTITSNGIPTFNITCTKHSQHSEFIEIPLPKHSSFTLRQFCISYGGMQKYVKHFQVKHWYQNDEVNSTVQADMKMVDLLLAIERSQEECMNTNFLNNGVDAGENKPIVVHCEGGCGRTGTFITLANSVERIKAETNVDIFQTVKRLREQRPHMIQSLHQYKFCYLTILSYIDSMCDYANFK